MVDYATPGVFATARNVLLAPARFYKHMPKSGGFAAPALFVVAMAVLAALISALLGIPAEGLFGALKLFVVKSVWWSVCALFWLVVASLLFFGLWKLLGARDNFETALRCTAYAFAMLPLFAVLKLSPSFGLPAGILYTAWLLVVASVHALGLGQGKAIAAFGLLAVIAIWKSFAGSDAALETAPAQHQDESPAAAANLQPADIDQRSADIDAAELDVDIEEAVELQQRRFDAIEREGVLAMPGGSAELQYRKPVATPGQGKAGANESAAQEAPALRAENAGRALGELVREVGDIARTVGDEIASGIDSGLQKITAEKDAGAVADAEDAKNADEKAGSEVTSSKANGLDAAAAGEAVGSIVRSIGDAAREAGEGLKSALAKEQPESASDVAPAGSANAIAAEKKPAADTNPKAPPEAAASKAPAANKAPATNEALATLQESAAAVGEMTPEQLGAALGEFINRLNSAAEKSASGFEQGLKGDAAASQEDSAAADAGEVLGRFLRGFNAAVSDPATSEQEQ